MYNAVGIDASKKAPSLSFSPQELLFANPLMSYIHLMS